MTGVQTCALPIYISIDLPHIKFIHNAGKVADFSCFMSFYQFAALDSAMITAHVNGRHVISNVQAPYCGFIDPDQSWEKFKKDLYDKIHEAMELPLNQESQAYYLKEADPVRFKETIDGLLKKELVLVRLPALRSSSRPTMRIGGSQKRFGPVGIKQSNKSRSL